MSKPSHDEIDASKLEHLPDNSLGDDCRIEFAILGPWWSPIMRIRVYPKHRPKDHITMWKVHKVSNYLGSWTPPPWLLKLLGQVDD